MRILLLYGDGTQAIPTIKSLYKKGYIVDAVASDKFGYGSNSRYLAKCYYFTEVEDVDKYYLFLKGLLKEVMYDVVIPMRDENTKLLSKYRKQLLQYTHFLVPNDEIFERGFDKHKLMEVCQEYCYPHPQTTIVQGGSLDSVDLNMLKYPILIKPNHTAGGRGMTLVQDRFELEEKYPTIYKQYGECHLQTYIPSGGAQVEVQLYVDEQKRLVNSSVIYKYRWYPENGGSSCCAKSVKNDEIVQTLYKLLLDIGWVGFADFDTIEDPRTGELLIMELNPRFPACVKAAFEAGVDWAEIIVNGYLGQPQRTYDYIEGEYLRHLGFEALWFYYSKNRWSTKPNWFKLLGRHVHYQDMSDWTDVKPFIVGTYGNIKKQLNPEFRKAKSGTRKTNVVDMNQTIKCADNQVNTKRGGVMFFTVFLGISLKAA